jgi:transcriptional regulator with XRE-family HTH domain
VSDGASDAHNGPKIGRSLELARKKQGLSLKQVEEATKIRAGYLEDLERENFDVMPAVYVQGSLKTYANFLQLDGEALVRELKRRQEPREPAYVEPQKDATQDHPTIPLGAAAVVGGQGTTEEDAGSTLIPAGIVPYLYLVAGVFLVLVAVALVLMIPAGDEPPAVSQVREPLISQAPTGTTPVDTGEDESAHQPRREGKERGAGDGGDDHKPERSTGPPEADTGDRGNVRTAEAGQDRDTSRPERGSRDAAATHSASPTPEAASAEPETAEPETASTPSPAAEEPGSPGNRTRRHPSGSRDDKDFDVRITAGSDDPVRITGGVPAMDND